MEWSRERIWETALAQSAVDIGCEPADFLRGEPVVTLARTAPGARRDLARPLDCHLVSYGNNVVAAAGEAYREIVWDYLRRFPPEHCFDTPHLHVLNSALEAAGSRVCFMTSYFLPDLTALEPLPCPYPVRVLRQADFAALYTDDWSNALCAKRRELDVLGIGAYDGETLVGLAACSADCGTMRQIGIDVLPAYRRQGIAAALTSRLALAVLDQGLVPFYGAAWCNIRSVRNASRSGFRPAWAEVTAKPAAFVEELNRGRGR